MTKMEELLQKLQADNVDEDQIAIILTEVTKAASVKLYTQLVNALDDKERQLLDETTVNGEQETNGLLDALYQRHYSTTADQAVTDLQEQFASSFLENYDLAEITS